MREYWRKFTAKFLILFFISTNCFSFSLLPEEVENAFQYMDLEKYTSLVNSYQQVCNINDNDLGALGQASYQNICNIMMETSYCKDVPKEKRVNCNDFDQNEIDVTSWYFIKKCATGLWESIKDLIIFLKDAIVWAVENFNGEKRQDRIDTANEFYNSIVNYLSIEFEKAMETLEGEDYQEIKAANAVFGNILTKAFKTVGSIIQKEYIKLGCYGPKERVQMLCKAIGDITMPPAFAVGLIVKGPSLLRKTKKLAWIDGPRGPPRHFLKTYPKSEVLSNASLTLSKRKELIKSLYPELSKKQIDAILDAHKNPSCPVYKCTQEQLDLKLATMRDAGVPLEV